MIKTALGIAGLVLMGSGYIYDHSDSFKTSCAEHKIAGTSLGWFKNTVCDLDFTLS